MHSVDTRLNIQHCWTNVRETNSLLMDGRSYGFSSMVLHTCVTAIGMYGDSFSTYLKTFDKHWTHM